MRFVWAVVAFVLAAVLIGAGIAQRTVFLGPKDVSAELTVKAPQHYTVIDSAVLRAHPGEQKLVAHGDGTIFVAQARDADLDAWLSDTSYNRITLAKDGSTRSEVVEPKTTADGAKAQNRNPAGSDLWLDSVTDKNTLIDQMQVPEGVSVLVASDGKTDAPSDVVVSWPLDNATPWAGPLMVAGGVFLLLGLVLYVLAIRHSRRGRGPRRKAPPPLPETSPIDVPEHAEIEGTRTEASRGAAPASGPKRTYGNRPGDAAAERRAVPTQRRRALLIVPAVGVAAALLSGCTPDAWPHPAVTATPTPTTTEAAEHGQQAPAVTQAQASRILESISGTLADADKKLDVDLAASRLDGPALEARKTAYKVRASVTDFALPPAIPADKIRILVPQAYDSWPRTVLMLVEHGTDQKVAPLIMTMTQSDPWSNYKISYVAEMQAAAKLPNMAPAWLGAKLTPPDSPFLAVEPKDVGRDFADVIDKGDKSPSYATFDKTALVFVKSFQDSRAALLKKLKDEGTDQTSTLTFAASAGTAAPVSMSAIDSGAVVAVTIQDTQTSKPSVPDASIINVKPDGTVVFPAGKALTGVDSSTKGFDTVYGVQLFFSVPAQGSTDKVTLLAVSQQLQSVTEIK
ncbi:glycosyl transferase [Microbacterium sp. 22242]|uniref:glycosyl transferase n=1 Tax=Microbacterium sp. 22242 TaxID=3453896 RepID=UPI003F830DFB